MDLRTAMAMLSRRWRVVLAGLLITTGVVSFVMFEIPLTYKATGSIVLVPPPLSAAAAVAANNPAGRNPFLSFSSSLIVLANISIQSLEDQSEANALRQQGATATYTFGTGGDGRTPLISVLASSKHPSEPMRTVQVVLQGAERELTRQQESLGAPADTLVKAVVLTHPDKVTKSWGGRTKYMAAAIGLGLLGTFLSVAAADRRSRRRKARATEPVVEEEGLTQFDRSTAAGGQALPASRWSERRARAHSGGPEASPPAAAPAELARASGQDGRSPAAASQPGD